MKDLWHLSLLLLVIHRIDILLFDRGHLLINIVTLQRVILMVFYVICSLRSFARLLEIPDLKVLIKDLLNLSLIIQVILRSLSESFQEIDDVFPPAKGNLSIKPKAL